MTFRNLSIGIMFLSQTTVGILGNFSLLSHYIAVYYKGCYLKSTDLILTHLIIANSLVVLFQGIPYTMAAFGLSQPFSDVGCKLLLYVCRVSRSMSIGTTCLLSVFQAITISPRNSCWNNLKIKAPKHVAFITSFCWILYIGVNLIFPVHTKWNSKNTTKKKRYFELCPTVHNEFTDSLYVVFMVFPEVLFSGLITWSSSSMVVILYRHKQQVQYIQNSLRFPRTSPETKATQSILALVSTFLTFNTLSAILHAYSACSHGYNWWLINIAAIISLWFPTLCPFVLKSQDSTVSRFCLVWNRETETT